MSANDFQVSLSDKNPNSFIYYTTTRRWSEEGFKIKEIKTKPPTKSILQKKKKLDDAIADFIKNNPDGEKIVSDLFNNKKKC